KRPSEHRVFHVRRRFTAAEPHQSGLGSYTGALSSYSRSGLVRHSFGGAVKRGRECTIGNSGASGHAVIAREPLRFAGRNGPGARFGVAFCEWRRAVLRSFWDFEKSFARPELKSIFGEIKCLQSAKRL